MDIIGTIYTQTGEFTKDSEGNENPVMQALVGFHVNTPKLVEGWESKQVTPNSPTRVYAGHPTYFYMFSNAEEFNQMAIEAGLIQPEEPEVIEEI